MVSDTLVFLARVFFFFLFVFVLIYLLYLQYNNLKQVL